MSWAAFHVLEVMSSQNYSEKRIGYLAAVQSFRPDTEVLVLAENLLKKVRHGQPSRRALTEAGSHIRPANHDIASANSDPSCNQSVHGELAVNRLASATFTQPGQHPQEDSRDAVSSGPGLPRHSPTGMAQDQGTAL